MSKKDYVTWKQYSVLLAIVCFIGIFVASNTATLLSSNNQIQEGYTEEWVCEDKYEYCELKVTYKDILETKYYPSSCDFCKEISKENYTYIIYECIRDYNKDWCVKGHWELRR